LRQRIRDGVNTRHFSSSEQIGIGEVGPRERPGIDALEEFATKDERRHPKDSSGNGFLRVAARGCLGCGAVSLALPLVDGTVRLTGG
jgi:hypothetical protein